jgi:hypothetical protein
MPSSSHQSKTALTSLHLGWLFALLISPAAFLAGCATSKVWEEGQFARFHEPATPVNLLLFESDQRGDVLVEYDEWREGNDKIWRRAYWLKENTAHLERAQKPRFVSVEHGPDLSPIAILEAPPIGGDVSALHHSAITSNQVFVLYSGQSKIGSYELPVYRDSSGRLLQIAITPIAVVADLTIVGGFLFVWVWSSGGFSWVH